MDHQVQRARGLAIVTAAGRPDDPHTARLACSRTIGNITADHQTASTSLSTTHATVRQGLGRARDNHDLAPIVSSANSTSSSRRVPRRARQEDRRGDDFDYLDASLNNYRRQVARRADDQICSGRSP
jgi:hypothetical protein